MLVHDLVWSGRGWPCFPNVRVAGVVVDFAKVVGSARMQTGLQRMDSYMAGPSGQGMPVLAKVPASKQLN